MGGHAAMAAGFDKLEKRLEKLGKVIAKKKRDLSRGPFGTDGTSPLPLSLSAVSDSILRTFPQPSFIRPTSTKMLARDEVGSTYRPEQRSKSLPETSTAAHLAALASAPEAELTPGSGIGQPPRIPKRSSSLSPTRRPASLASLGELLEFSFADPPRKRSGSKVPSGSRPRSGSISPTAQLSSTRHSDEIPDTRGAHHRESLVTPPPSAEYDKSFASTKLSYQNGLPTTPPAGELTPEPSPKFEPAKFCAPDKPEADSILRSPRPKSLDVSTTLFGETKLPLRRALSCSGLGDAKLEPAANPPPTKTTSAKDKTARARRDSATSKEPSVKDFLSLSDEDVAGDTSVPLARLPLSSSKPPSCTLPPDPPGLVPPPQVSAGTRLLTLSPPLATRPATAAAFEAARIATRYKFDLVYVVNLWPSRISSGKVEMTGRLLAAYGLPFLTSPFRIPESVHLKVLRTDGWLEYRCEDVMPEEFSRGYSCSFYTGRSLGRGPTSTDKGAPAGSPRERKGRAPNRGIVFAAYRLPHADGCGDLPSDEAELASLRADAEALVDMLIDIHMTQRQRRPVPLMGCSITTRSSQPPHNAVLSI